MDQPMVIQVVGYKNRGKTTLVARLVAVLKTQGYHVGTIKHASHHFDLDQEGTDTWQHREAGAETVAVTSPRRTAILEEQSKSIHELLAEMAHLDIVVAEGFKTAPFPKIALIKETEDQALLHDLENVCLIAIWDDPLHVKTDVPVKAIDDIDGMVHAIMHGT